MTARASLVVATVLVVGLQCARSRVDEPAPGERGDAAVTVTTPADGPWERIQGGWFELKVPPRWQTLPLTSDKRRAMFAIQLNTPRDQPDVIVLVTRPRPLDVGDAGASASATRLARTLNLAQGQPADAPTETGKLAGEPAVIVAATGTKPNGQATSLKTWSALKDGHLLMVTCGGTGAGLPLAARVCPDIVASFALSAPLPAPPPIEAPTPAALVPRQLGDVTVSVPSDWQSAGSDWFPPPAIGGARSVSAPSGPFEVATLHVSRFPGAASAEALADQLATMPTMTRVRRSPVTLPIGPAIETELTDGLGSRSLLYDLVKGGVGYELTCEAPERGFDRYRPMCLATAKSLTLGAPPKKH